MTGYGRKWFEQSRRELLRSVAGVGAAGLLAGEASGGDPPSGGGPPSPSGRGGGAVGTVTLITGHTIKVTERGGERHYDLAAGDEGSFHLAEREDGTYVVPHGVDLDRYSPELFDVDLLVEQGLTDEETDAIPVVATLADGVEVQATDASTMATTGFAPSGVLASIDAVAGAVRKEQAATASQDVLASDAVETVYLDVEHEALLDTSTGAVNAPAAREEYGVDGSGVSIAVLDTGIDADHPDFGDRVVHQQDFSGDGVQDEFGHGTHCAGIAAGDGTVSDGEYVGIAPGADLMNVKVLGDSGTGRTSAIVSGIEHAVEQGADVINMSLGGPPQEGSPLVQAVDAAVENGVVAAVAAGNTPGYRTVGSPGVAERALTVGASNDEDGGLARFSSAGPTPDDYRVKPDVLAPGVRITATGSEHAGGGGFGGGESEYPYTEKSGTSMAAPHVAGLAALLLADDPGRTPDDVRDALVATADPLDDANVYQQGGGVVDATAALGSDLRVHDTVVDFGLYRDATTDAATVELENTGGEAVEVDVPASLANVQSGASLPDNVEVSPSTLAIDPGATATVDLTIHTDGAHGFNSGVLTFEAGSATHRAVFGFVRGIEVVVEKIPHESRGTVAGDTLDVWSHDGTVDQSALRGFDADGEATVLLLSDGGEFTLWSAGQLGSGGKRRSRRGGKGRKVGEPTLTVASGVRIDEENTQFTLDERGTVARTLDTRPIREHEPLATRKFAASLHANLGDGETRTQSQAYLGDFGVRTVHVTPVDEADPTNVSTEYAFTPAEETGRDPLDAPVAYHLFYGSRSVDARDPAVRVEPDDLARERFEYYRNRPGQRYGVSPHLFPADRETYPTSVSFAGVDALGSGRDEQTWYRTASGSYQEIWYEDATFDSDWEFKRTVPLVPAAGATYRQAFNREPLVGRLSEWTLDDGRLDATGHWYADQADASFDVYREHSRHDNEVTVTVDGSVVGSGTSSLRDFSVELTDLDAGSEVAIAQRGNTLRDTSRGTATATEHGVTYRPGTANVPPRVDAVDVTGLDALETVPAGRFVVFVDVERRAAGGGFRAFYADAGAVADPPSDDPGGWREGEVVYAADGTYGVLLDAAGHAGSLSLSLSATDGAGNRVETTTFDAVTVAEGAQVGVPLEIRTRNVALDSNQRVVVRIADGDVAADRIAPETLRFGDPRAVNAGDGASPVAVQRLGNGGLQAKFAARDLGYACEDGPVAGQLRGALADGTAVSGAGVLPTVTCRDSDRG